MYESWVSHDINDEDSHYNTILSLSILYTE